VIAREVHLFAGCELVSYTVASVVQEFSFSLCLWVENRRVLDVGRGVCRAALPLLTGNLGCTSATLLCGLLWDRAGHLHTSAGELHC
jgi:hypothetical protein